MLAKTGGLSALLDRGVVTQCPLCDTDNPDLNNRGFCSACGALFRDKMRRRLLLVKAAILLGAALTVVGAALTLALDLRWSGIALFLLGIVPLVFGILANRQLAGFLLEALARRTANDTQRSVRTTQRVAAGLVVFFLAAVLGSIPYYLYIERPRQKLGLYQARFEGKLNEYLALVPDDAEPAADAKPYLEGKAVVVEKTASGPKVSEVHVALRPEVRAETPDEVGTVVLLEWKDFQYSEYGVKGSGILAFRIDGDVRVVNLRDKALLAHDIFQGGPAPEVAPRGGGHGRGPKPLAKVAGYVGGLDRNVPPPKTEASAGDSEKADEPEAKRQDNPKSATKTDKK